MNNPGSTSDNLGWGARGAPPIVSEAAARARLLAMQAEVERAAAVSLGGNTHNCTVHMRWALCLQDQLKQAQATVEAESSACQQLLVENARLRATLSLHSPNHALLQLPPVKPEPPRAPAQRAAQQLDGDALGARGSKRASHGILPAYQQPFAGCQGQQPFAGAGSRGQGALQPAVGAWSAPGRNLAGAAPPPSQSEWDAVSGSAELGAVPVPVPPPDSMVGSPIADDDAAALLSTPNLKLLANFLDECQSEEAAAKATAVPRSGSGSGSGSPPPASTELHFERRASSEKLGANLNRFDNLSRQRSGSPSS